MKRNKRDSWLKQPRQISCMHDATMLLSDVAIWKEKIKEKQTVLYIRSDFRTVKMTFTTQLSFLKTKALCSKIVVCKLEIQRAEPIINNFKYIDFRINYT